MKCHFYALGRTDVLEKFKHDHRNGVALGLAGKAPFVADDVFNNDAGLVAFAQFYDVTGFVESKSKDIKPTGYVGNGCRGKSFYIIHCQIR